MQPIETLALSKATNGTAKTARSSVKAGVYPVDFAVRVQGRVTIGEDYESAPTASIPFKLALAALAHIAGCTGKTGIAKIEKAMRLALETGDDAKEILAEIMPKIEEVEAAIINPMLAKLPKNPCNGKVTTKLTVERVPCLVTNTCSCAAAC